MGKQTVVRALGVAVAAALVGCVAYRPAQLPGQPDLKASVSGLTLPSQRVEVLPGLQPRRIDPRAPLDATDVAILAVLNDPALRASEGRRDVAAAQLFAAGLLPDPELSLTALRPAGGGATQSGSDLGLGEALVPLVTRGDRIRAAQARLREVDLGLLWQGWQVAQRARWLSAEIVADRRLLTAEGSARDAMRRWHTRIADAATAGAANAEEISAAGGLAGEAAGDVGATERDLNDAEQALRALLGLAPTARLPLRASPLPAISTSAVADAMQNLPERRPDLLALAAGFRSSDQDLRAAIAAQFPAIGVSFLSARDVQGVGSLGIGLTLRLPFFDGNRGAIRKAEAGRKTLRLDYQARLDQAVSDVARLERDDVLLTREVARLDAAQVALGADRGRLQSLAAGGAASGLEALQVSLQFYRTRQRAVAAELALRKTRIALETLLGVPPQRLHGDDTGESS